CGDEVLRSRLDALADTGSRIEILRAKAINTLIHGCATGFANNPEKFLHGTFGMALMDAVDGNLVGQMKKISEISVDRIYNASTVVQIEIAGFKVMNALLEEFIPVYV